MAWRQNEWLFFRSSWTRSQIATISLRGSSKGNGASRGWESNGGSYLGSQMSAMKSVLLVLVVIISGCTSQEQAQGFTPDPNWAGDWERNAGGTIVKLRLQDGDLVAVSIIDDDGEVYESRGVEMEASDKATLCYYVPSTEYTVWNHMTLESRDRITYSSSNSAGWDRRTSPEYYFTRLEE